MHTRHLLLYIAVLSAAVLSGCSAPLHCGYVGVSGGGRLYYEERGRGEAVVLLHGHSLDHRMWREQVGPLSRHYRVVTPDLRGYGLSSDQAETLPMTHADDVVALLDSLGIAQAHVVGLSMGAFVAGDLLAMQPGRLLSCVMASGGIRRSSPGPGEPIDAAEQARRDSAIAAVKAQGVDVMKRAWLGQLMASGGSHRERMRQPLQQMITDWSAWQALHKEVRLYYGRQAWDRLKQLRPTLPVLLLRGECEHKSGLPQELRYLPRGQALTLPDCGHMMNMERPRLFNKTLLRFLKEAAQQQRAF